MAVQSKVSHNVLLTALRHRIGTLYACLETRELNDPSEGVRKGSWRNPQNMYATEGTALEIRLAVDDFKSILAEIKKLK